MSTSAMFVLSVEVNYSLPSGPDIHETQFSVGGVAVMAIIDKNH